MPNLKELYGKLSTAVNEIKQEILNLDEQIASKRKQRSDILSAPISKEDYLGFIRQEIRACHNGFDQRMVRELKKQPINLPSLLRQQESPLFRAHIFTPAYENHHQYYFEDLIFEGVKKAVDAHFEDKDFKWPDNAMPVEERLIKIKEIDSEIDDLNVKRDELCSSLVEIDK